MKRRVPLVALLLLTACSATAPTMLDGDVSLVVSPHVRGDAQRTLQANVSGLSSYDIYSLDLTLSDGTTTSAPRTYTAAQLTAEVDWLTALAERIASGSLPWHERPVDPATQQAVTDVACADVSALLPIPGRSIQTTKPLPDGSTR